MEYTVVTSKICETCGKVFVRTAVEKDCGICLQNWLRIREEQSLPIPEERVVYSSRE